MIGAVIVAFGAAIPLLGGVGLVAGGLVLVRRARSDTGRRIPVEAVVVDHTFMVQPARVTFDYPTPWGPLRATRTVGVPVVRASGITVSPGDGLTVWVNPSDPRDVTLGPGGASTLVGYVMIAAGSLMGLVGLGMAALPALGVLLG